MNDNYGNGGYCLSPNDRLDQYVTGHSYCKIGCFRIYSINISNPNSHYEVNAEAEMVLVGKFPSNCAVRLTFESVVNFFMGNPDYNTYQLNILTSIVGIWSS